MHAAGSSYDSFDFLHGSQDHFLLPRPADHLNVERQPYRVPRGGCSLHDLEGEVTARRVLCLGGLSVGLRVEADWKAADRDVQHVVHAGGGEGCFRVGSGGPELQHTVNLHESIFVIY